MNKKKAYEIIYKVGRELLAPSIQYQNLVYWYEGKSKLGTVSIEEYESAINFILKELEKYD